MDNYFTVMNNSVMVEEEPVRNGIKNIELRDLSKLGYEKVCSDDFYEQKRPASDTSSTNSSLSSGQHVQMKKGVGLLSGVALIVGTMIGEFLLLSCLVVNFSVPFYYSTYAKLKLKYNLGFVETISS